MVRAMPSQLTTSRGEVAIRPAVPQDAAAAFELRLEALSRHPQAFAADPALTEERGVTAWVELIAENVAQERGVIYVAAAGGRLIGMTGLARGKWPKTGHSGTIWGVYVQPAWRGLGVAGALVEGCVAWARDLGLVIVKLGVVTSNAGAIRCYTRCGFTVYGVEPQVIRHEGALHDELLMARAI